MRIRHLLVIAALGLGVFWFFGRAQPIQSGSQSIPTTQVAACPDCGGTGFVAGPAQICTKCGGTGQGEWQMKSKSSRSLSKTKPICVVCGGRGSVSSRTTCPRCSGTGKTSGSAARSIQTVRAGLSPWEEFLSWFGVEPEANPGPQQNRQGEYPLVAAYLDVWAGKGKYRVEDWGLFQDVNGTWQSTLVLVAVRKDGTAQKRMVRVGVRNRAVVGCQSGP